MIKALFDAKANIQSRNNDTGYVPLHDAADSGSFDALKTLLELDAPHLPRTTDGRTPLYIANVAGHTEIVAYLGIFHIFFFLLKFSFWFENKSSHIHL